MQKMSTPFTINFKNMKIIFEVQYINIKTLGKEKNTID